MKKRKKFFYWCVVVSLFLFFYDITWHDSDNEFSYFENCTRHIVNIKACSNETHTETLCLIKFTSSVNEYHISRTNSFVSKFHTNIVVVLQDNHKRSRQPLRLLFDNKTIAKLPNQNTSELELLADWLNQKQSTKFLVYIDLINFKKNIKDIVNYLSKPYCLKCVCFLLNKRQQLIGFSGPKNQTIKLLKHPNLQEDLKNGLNNTHSISSKTELLYGITKFQYCDYDSKEHLCDGNSEHYYNSNNIEQNVSLLKQIENVLKDEVLHIVYATSMDQIEPMVISIKSILQSTSMKSKLHFHIFYYTNFSGNHLEKLKQLVTGCRALITFHRYNGLDEVEPLINKEYIDRPELVSPNNYIRLLLHKKLPTVKWCLWLDNDVFVLKDIIPLFAKVYVQGGHKTVAAFPRDLKKPFKLSLANTLEANGVKVSKSRYPRLQAGILFMDLEKWKNDNVFQEVLKISKLNRKLKLYDNLGSQAPIEILFNGNNFYHLDSNLKKQNLGYGSSSYMYIPCDAMFLHWNGAKKPWLSEWRKQPQNVLLWNHVLGQTEDLKC